MNRVAILSHGITDIGRHRSENQDQFLCAQVRRPVMVERASDAITGRHVEVEKGTLLAVADGMGGHAHGQTASRYAIESLQDYVTAHWSDFLSPGETADHVIIAQLKALFRQAHGVLTEMSRNDHEFRGLGTTLTVAFISWPKLYLAHAGDSRCYLMREGQLQQMTTDQTLGTLSLGKQPRLDNQNPLRSYHMPHVLYNCVGADLKQIAIECHSCELEPSDMLLLCSDGVNIHVADWQIAQIMDKAFTTASACQQLVDAANHAGGRDNITALISRCKLVDAKHESKAKKSAEPSLIRDGALAETEPLLQPEAYSSRSET